LGFGSLIPHLESCIGQKITQYKAVTGGDINLAFCIESVDQKYFVKCNDFGHGTSMLKTEAEGLLEINKTGDIAAAQVIGENSFRKYSFLILEWIDTSLNTQYDWESFAGDLANLHKNSSPAFGFNTNNFIGALAQSNTWHDRWINFYSEERILPQIQLAYDNNLLTRQDKSNAESFCVKLAQYCPIESPALIHGDLWSGNFMFNSEDKAVLIDPSAYYGHREMDLAMSKLFGGFPPAFYDAYQQHYPLAKDFESRTEIYQLYYLLVHLNLFGSSYANSCKHILGKFA
jgi:fructosamine-3-kinase